MSAPFADEVELLRAIQQGRVNAEVMRRADDMLRLSIILLRRLGGRTTLTIDELMSRTDDDELVFQRGGLYDPLDGRIVVVARKKEGTADDAR